MPPRDPVEKRWQTAFGPSLLEARERARQASAPHRPLWARSDAPLDEDRLRALHMIEQYDLAIIRERLVSTGAMTPGWADEAIFEFRRYLGLRAVFSEPITMLSADVDEVWHACILQTRLYADLCAKVFRRFLHHDPGTQLASDRWADWDQFNRAYRAVYGELGPLWGMIPGRD